MHKNTNTTLEIYFKTQMTFGRGRQRGNFGFRGRCRGRNNYQIEERKSLDSRGWRNQSLNSEGNNNN